MKSFVGVTCSKPLLRELFPYKMCQYRTIWSIFLSLEPEDLFSHTHISMDIIQLLGQINEQFYSYWNLAPRFKNNNQMIMRRKNFPSNHSKSPKLFFKYELMDVYIQQSSQSLKFTQTSQQIQNSTTIHIKISSNRPWQFSKSWFYSNSVFSNGVSYDYLS